MTAGLIGYAEPVRTGPHRCRRARRAAIRRIEDRSESLAAALTAAEVPDGWIDGARAVRTIALRAMAAVAWPSAASCLACRAIVQEAKA